MSACSPCTSVCLVSVVIIERSIVSSGSHQAASQQFPEFEYAPGTCVMCTERMGRYVCSVHGGWVGMTPTIFKKNQCKTMNPIMWRLFEFLRRRNYFVLSLVLLLSLSHTHTIRPVTRVWTVLFTAAACWSLLDLLITDNLFCGCVDMLIRL